MANEMMADKVRTGRKPPGQAANEDCRLGRIDVHGAPEPALAAWAELEAIAPGSLYQTRRWLLPWIATAGRAAGIKPLLVVGYCDDVPVAFLPLGVARRSGLRVAGFLGGKDSNTNIGLFRPGTDFNRADLQSLFAAVSAKAALKPDLFVLSNQPEQWENLGNPLIASLRHQPSPSYCHRGDLATQFDAFLRRHLSADGRKKLRQKQKRLAEIGPLAHVQAKTAQEVDRILDAFFVQKRERLTQMGAAGALDDPSTRAFLAAAAHEGLTTNSAAIELHALTVGERIVATLGGGTHRGCFHAMVNSFDLDPEIARCSPGELLLARLVEEKCRAGLTSFDLGIGEARYKNTWCDVAEPLFDAILPVTMKGRVAAWGESVRRRMKRIVKQTGWAWAFAQKLRAR
jgi:CelD/BcsL family acetyltransferase involved in cellulose biosynthesis